MISILKNSYEEAFGYKKWDDEMKPDFKRDIKWFFSCIPYFYRLWRIDAYDTLRKRIGKINAKFINTKQYTGIVKIHPWLLKLTKCVLPDDVYMVTGIYDALIKPQIIEGYQNMCINDDNYHSINKILEGNFEYNEQTMYNRNGHAIAFTWANYSPISVNYEGSRYSIELYPWQIMWSKGNIRELCNDKEKQYE